MLHYLWEKIPPRFIFLGFLLDEFNFLAVDGGQPYTTCKPFKPRLILLFPKYIPCGKIIFSGNFFTLLPTEPFTGGCINKKMFVLVSRHYFFSTFGSSSSKFQQVRLASQLVLYVCLSVCLSLLSVCLVCLVCLSVWLFCMSVCLLVC